MVFGVFMFYLLFGSYCEKVYILNFFGFSMGILNLLKDSVMAGFLSKKAFSNLKKGIKFEDSLIVFAAISVFGFCMNFLSLYFDEEFASIGIGILGLMAVSLIFLIFGILMLFVALVFSKWSFNWFLNKEKKEKELDVKKLFKIYVVCTIAMILPSFLGTIIVILFGVGLFTVSELISSIVIIGLICLMILYICHVAVKLTSELVGREYWKTLGCLVLAGVMMYGVLLLVIVGLAALAYFFIRVPTV